MTNTIRKYINTRKAQLQNDLSQARHQQASIDPMEKPDINVWLLIRQAKAEAKIDAYNSILEMLGN